MKDEEEWACLDLNQGPLLYQSSALTELSYRPFGGGNSIEPHRRVNVQHAAASGKRANDSGGSVQLKGPLHGSTIAYDTGEQLRWREPGRPVVSRGLRGDTVSER